MAKATETPDGEEQEGGDRKPPKPDDADSREPGQSTPAPDAGGGQTPPGPAPGPAAGTATGTTAAGAQAGETSHDTTEGAQVTSPADLLHQLEADAADQKDIAARQAKRLAALQADMADVRKASADIDAAVKACSQTSASLLGRHDKLVGNASPFGDLVDAAKARRDAYEHDVTQLDTARTEAQNKVSAAEGDLAAKQEAADAALGRFQQLRDRSKILGDWLQGLEMLWQQATGQPDTVDRLLAIDYFKRRLQDTSRWPDGTDLDCGTYQSDLVAALQALAAARADVRDANDTLLAAQFQLQQAQGDYAARTDKPLDALLATPTP